MPITAEKTILPMLLANSSGYDKPVPNEREPISTRVQPINMPSMASHNAPSASRRQQFSASRAASPAGERKPFSPSRTSRGMPPTAVAHTGRPQAMLLGGVAALGLGGPVTVNHAPSTWGWLFALGLLTCYLAYICYGLGLKRISLVRAAVTCHLEPVLGTLWVWLFWNESFSAAGWLGGALVLGAVLLLTTDKTGE